MSQHRGFSRVGDGWYVEVTIRCLKNFMRSEMTVEPNAGNVEPTPNELDMTLEQVRAVWLSRRQAAAEAARRMMFDTLKRGGYDQVEVDYDGHADSGQVQSMSFSKGAEKVPDDAVPVSVKWAVEYYLYAALPGGWEIKGGSWGTARIYPASEYVAFHHVARSEEFMPFEDGEPGPEVSEEDRW